jgi:hypothetical protein
VHEHRAALRTGLVLPAGLVVVFLDRPSGGDILAVALTLVVLLGAVEFLNQPCSPGGAAAHIDGRPRSDRHREG